MPKYRSAGKFLTIESDTSLWIYRVKVVEPGAASGVYTSAMSATTAAGSGNIGTGVCKPSGRIGTGVCKLSGRIGTGSCKLSDRIGTGVCKLSGVRLGTGSGTYQVVAERVVTGKAVVKCTCV